MVTAGHNHSQAIILIGSEIGSLAGSEGTGVESELSGAQATFAISVSVGLGSKVDPGSKVEVGSWVSVGEVVVAVGGISVLFGVGGSDVAVGGISVGFGVGGSDVGVG